MVSLHHTTPPLQWEPTWLLVLLLSTISLLSGLLYCLPFRSLFQGKSLTQTLRPKSQHQRKQKHMITPNLKSANTVPVHVQQPTISRTKPKTAKIKPQVFLGKIQLHLKFNKSRSVLEVRVICGQNLAAKDFTGSSDPYCKLLLLPARDKKLRTKVKPRTCSPLWQEIISFVVMKNDLPQQTLYVYVLDHDHLHKDDMIGECRFNLCNYDLDHGQTIWRELRPFAGYARYLGDILLSLCYSASREKLTVNILKCTNLRAMDANNMSDPYVKLFNWKNGKKSGKQKTITKFSTRNPVYNESFSFEVSLTRIHACEILVEVMDYDRVGSNERIGCVLLGENGSDAVSLHWRDMCNTMDTPLTRWHRLKKHIEG